MAPRGTPRRRRRAAAAALLLLGAGGVAGWLARRGVESASIEATEAGEGDGTRPAAPPAVGRDLAAAPARRVNDAASADPTSPESAAAPRPAARSLPLRVDVVDRATGQAVAGATWATYAPDDADAEWRAAEPTGRTPAGDERAVSVVVATDTTLRLDVAAPTGWLVAPVDVTFAVSARTERLRAVVPVVREARIRLTLLDVDFRPVERPPGVAFTVDGVPTTATLEPDDGAGRFRVRGIPWTPYAVVVAQVVESLETRVVRAFVRRLASGAIDVTPEVPPAPDAAPPPSPARGVLVFAPDDLVDLRIEGLPPTPEPAAEGPLVVWGPGARIVLGTADRPALQLAFGRLQSARAEVARIVLDFQGRGADVTPTLGAVEVDLRDEGGGPAAGVPVELDGRVAWTDATGRARFHDVETGAFDLRPADPLVRFPTRVVRVVAPEATRVDVVAQAPATLEVEVVDETGAPWPFADVFVVAESGSRVADVTPSREQRLDASADLEGRRTVHGMPAGEVVVEGRVAGRSTTVRVRVAAGERAAVRVVVPRAAAGG